MALGLQDAVAEDRAGGADRAVDRRDDGVVIIVDLARVVLELADEEVIQACEVAGDVEPDLFEVDLVEPREARDHEVLDAWLSYPGHAVDHGGEPVAGQQVLQNHEQVIEHGTYPASNVWVTVRTGASPL